jgi:hypothetical protein
MDVKPMLTEIDIPASYADREGFMSLLKMHILEHSFALNTQGYFYRPTHDGLIVGKLKDFTRSEEKVEEMAELPKISSL